MDWTCDLIFIYILILDIDLFFSFYLYQSIIFIYFLIFFILNSIEYFGEHRYQIFLIYLQVYTICHIFIYTFLIKRDRSKKLNKG